MDQRLAAGGYDLARDGFCFGAVAARVDEDGRTAFRQRQRDGAADIAAGAGDNGDLAAEFVVAHVRLSAQRRKIDAAMVKTRHQLQGSIALRLCPAAMRDVERNLSITSCRVSGSCAPPRKCGCRSSITLPSFRVARMCPVIVVGIGIVGIDHEFHLGRQREHAGRRGSRLR